jgi:hypothetical protein
MFILISIFLLFRLFLNHSPAGTFFSDITVLFIWRGKCLSSSIHCCVIKFQGKVLSDPRKMVVATQGCKKSNFWFAFWKLSRKVRFTLASASNSLSLYTPIATYSLTRSPQCCATSRRLHTWRLHLLVFHKPSTTRTATSVLSTSSFHRWNCVPLEFSAVNIEMSSQFSKLVIMEEFDVIGEINWSRMLALKRVTSR